MRGTFQFMQGRESVVAKKIAAPKRSQWILADWPSRST
jgi:hypothetical protein